MPTDWKKYVESTPEVLRGKPCIRGTRIPVSLVLGYLAAGHSAADIIKEFPGLELGANRCMFGLRPRIIRV